ncbi:integrase [Leisingera sp. JC11]|uniref:integrase n=1 Tax=Leisingera sp. JC11 TaxID=3042469 RepID=UPI003453EF0B
MADRGGREKTSGLLKNCPPFLLAAPTGTRDASSGESIPGSQKHIWADWVRLEIAKTHRDLALFNRVIDRKHRGCDLVMLKVSDTFASGQV